MWNRIALLFGLLLWLPLATAVPLCSDIFTDPPSGSHNPGLEPPPGLEPSRGNFICGRRGCGGTSDVFTPGDYNYSYGEFKQGSFVRTNGATTRLYFNNLNLTQASLNRFGKAENLIIYVRNNLSISGQNYVNAIVYVAGNVSLAGQASIDGALAAGGSLNISGNGSVDVDQDAIDNADFGGMCNTTQLSCFSDDFARTSLGDDWATKVLGSSRPPSLTGGRLNITQAIGNQATAVTYQRLFPAENNLVTVEFDYYAWSPQSGTGADGVAVILSDATITPQPGGYGGSLGYAQRSGVAGFAGGWIGVGLDEYGNFSNPSEGRQGGPGFRAQAVAIRGAASGNYAYLAGTQANLSPRIDVRRTSVPAPGHRYRLTVDSRTPNVSMVSLARNTGSGFVDLVAPFNARSFPGQSTVPADFYLSLTGSTGGSNNNHEIDNFQVCALDSRPVGPLINHFEFDYSDSPLTCDVEEMTIRACKNADCSELFTDPVTANLLPVSSTNGGWLGGAQVSFSGGTGKVYLSHTSATVPVTIGVSGSVPGTLAGSDTLCRKGSGPKSIAACTINFADSGFVFDIPDKYAGQVETLKLKAVKKDDATKQCVPSFANVTRDLLFWSGYQTPTAAQIIGTPQVTVNGTPVGTSETSAEHLVLNFDAAGEAQINVDYPDAGQLSLSAKYIGSDVTGDPGLLMTGSDIFVSSPYGFCVATQANEGQCNSPYESCNVFKRAGEPFNLLISPVAWKAASTDFCSNNTTPNFAWSRVALAHELVAPSGGVAGQASVQEYGHVAGTTPNTVAQSVSEVGVFRFGTAAFSGYLGSNKTIQASNSQPLGRFVPAKYIVKDVSLIPGCSGFSYMDQPTPLTMTIEAQNLGSVVTQNYQGVFAKGVAQLQAENADDGINLSARLSSLGGSWNQGSMTFGASNSFLFARTTAPGADGPFELLDIGLGVDDNDGEYSQLSPLDMKPDSSGDCTLPSNNCTAQRLGTIKMRHGRLVLENTYGPENEILRMPARTQVWQGSGWGLSVDDSCTLVDPALPTPQVDDPARGYVFEPDLSAGQSIVRSATPAQFSAGMLDLYWQAQGSPLYRGQVTAPLEAPQWLKWYWNWDNSSPNSLFDPRASAYFGRFRGDDRIIFWREVN